jgi:cytochrome b561
MTLRNTSAHWGLVARALHWLFLFLVIGAWYAVETREEFPKGTPERSEWMRLHISLGLTIFALVWVRLGWRLSGEVPAEIQGPPLQMLAARLVHFALYALMVIMPVTGLLTVQMEDRAVSWFGLFELPVLVGPDKEMAELLEEAHADVLWPLLLALVGVHAAAALWHHFRLKDDTLRRMTFPRR